MACLMWFSVDFSSPLNLLFRENQTVGMAFVLINWPGIIFGMMVSGNAHGGSELWNSVGIFLQWTVLGSLFAWLRTRKNRKSKQATVSRNV